MDLDGDKLEMHVSGDVGAGEVTMETQPQEHAPESVRVGLNPTFLASALSCATAQKVIISAYDEQSPVVVHLTEQFESAGRRPFLAIIMPVRL